MCSNLTFYLILNAVIMCTFQISKTIVASTQYNALCTAIEISFTHFLDTAMKYLVVLLCLVSVVYSYPLRSDDTSFPAILFNGEKVNDTFDVTRIETTFDKTLECVTDLETCCTSPEGFHKGYWYDPNEEKVNFSFSGTGDRMFQSRGNRTIRLSRKGMGCNEGQFCCKVETKRVNRQREGDDFVGEEVCVDLTGECS